MIETVLRALERDMEPDAAARFVELTAAYLQRTRGAQGPVSTACTPAELAERFDEPLPSAGRPLEEVAARLERDVLSDVNRLMHPMCMGHQVSPPLPAAIWAEPIISATNQSTAVLEMSPTATPIELRVVRWMCDLAGFGPEAGGTFTSGGTEATFTALLAARAAAMPDAWHDGVGADPPVILCGEHAHYAVTRAAGELGIGTSRAVMVPSREYRMDPAALEAQLAELQRSGTRVMAVVATSGSTATGSFDDLEAIADLCARHQVWLHVDGAHGASALFSGRHRHRLRGLGRAQSIAWDPHKMMLMPLACGVLLVRDERALESAFSQRAPYLFHGSGDRGRIIDQGVRSFLCSRRADALKVWVCLQRYGAGALGEIYDHLCATTRTLYEQIVDREEFEPVHEPEANILCFRYRDTGASRAQDTGVSAERDAEAFRGSEAVASSAPSTSDEASLDEINREIRERYNRSGRGWITTTVLGGRRVLRVTIMNPRTRPEHTAALLDGLAEVAREVR